MHLHARTYTRTYLRSCKMKDNHVLCVYYLIAEIFCAPIDVITQSFGVALYSKTLLYNIKTL